MFIFTCDAGCRQPLAFPQLLVLAPAAVLLVVAGIVRSLLPRASGGPFSACCWTDSAGGQESFVPAMTHLGRQLVVTIQWLLEAIRSEMSWAEENLRKARSLTL
jgi:hypothetical protein